LKKKTNAFAKVCHLTGKAIVDFAMIAAGDRIVVGVSGGTDSLLLMHVLKRLQSRAPVAFELFPVTVDMGFGDFDAALLSAYAQEQGWGLEILPFPGAEMMRERNAEARPCAMCSRLRRGQLHGFMQRQACGKLALGQHLDDMCVSFLMSTFRGGGLKTMGPNVAADGGRGRLIRPFCYVRKALIMDAAADMAFPAVKSCDYADRLRECGDRAYLERLLNQLDGHFGDVRGAMLRSLSDLRPAHLLDRRWLPVPELGDDAAAAPADDLPPQ
jgi:tRNA 2-thiocytidine biosynthesis protein TtcA